MRTLRETAPDLSVEMYHADEVPLVLPPAVVGGVLVGAAFWLVRLRRRTASALGDRGDRGGGGVAPSGTFIESVTVRARALPAASTSASVIAPGYAPAARGDPLEGRQPSTFSEIHDVMFTFLGENTTRKVGGGEGAS